jgi:hypothetical protein
MLYTGGPTPLIVDADISLSQSRSKTKAKRGKNNPVAKADTVSDKDCISANTGAENDPTIAVDEFNNNTKTSGMPNQRLAQWEWMKLELKSLNLILCPTRIILPSIP